jgi:hypothetical protein
MDQTTLVQQTEIAGAITAILRHLGYMADPFPYSDSERKSVILMVSPPGEPKTLFNVEIWKVVDKKQRVEKERIDG